MHLKRIHHVAYRCRDAGETVAFYQRVLGMKFVLAIAENQVPSTRAPDPYMHVFLDAGMGSILAFFELPNSQPMGVDPNTPDWVQHIAFELGNMADLHNAREMLLAEGLEVVGPTNHGIFQSIYFRDPNGHRLELAVNTASEAELDKLHAVAPAMLLEWTRTKRAPTHAAWLHEKEFSGDSE